MARTRPAVATSRWGVGSGRPAPVSRQGAHRGPSLPSRSSPDSGIVAAGPGRRPCSASGGAQPGLRLEGGAAVARCPLPGLAHVHLYAYGLLFGRGLLPEPALRTFDASLASLERAGLDRQAAAEMHRTLLSFAVGYGLLELPAASLSGSTELERLVSIARAVRRDAPVKLVEVARLMADCHMDYQFQLGLHLIITGLAVRLKEEK